MNRTFNRTGIALVASLGLVLAACGSSDDDDPATDVSGGGGTTDQVVTFDAKSLIENVTDNVITATYVDLDGKATALQTAVDAMQEGGVTDTELLAAQEAWREARVPWESSEGFLFGPVDSLGIDPAIDSWPLNTPDLAAFIEANPSATQQDIENAGDDLRGFHAIEYLLFGDGVDDNVQSATEISDGELAYLVALSGAFKSRTGQLATSWTTDFNGQGPYSTLVKTAGTAGNTTYASGTAVLEELVNAIAGIADEVANAKIAEPLGTSIAAADTSKVESQYSWNSLTDFHNNIQSILNVYTGQIGYDPQSATIDAARPGVYALVAARDPALAERVLQEIVTAQEQLALAKGDGNNQTTEITGIARPFRTQIMDPAGRALVESAQAAVITVQNSLLNDVLPLVNSTQITN